MKLTVTLNSYQISIIKDSLDSRLKALNHVLDSNNSYSNLLDSDNLDSDNLDSCKLEIQQCKNLIKQLTI